MTQTLPDQEHTKSLMERFLNHPCIEDWCSRPLIRLLARLDGRHEADAIENSRRVVIPEYLQSNQFAVPLERYSEHGWSKKAKMFTQISDVTREVEREYGIIAPMPSVIPLTHKLWEKWLADGHKFDEKSRSALTDLLTQIITSSDTDKLVIRHLDDNGNNENVGVHSYPGISSVEDAIEKIETQYRHFASDDLRWQDKGHEVEVCVGIYPHADPPTFHSVTENGVETLSSGQPPLGIVVTTSQDGQKIQVDVGIGDNLGIQEVPGICDTYYFTFADPTSSGKNSLERSKSADYGARETIVQDRDGKLIQAIHLPTYMLNRPIRIDEADINRVAYFAAVAAKKYGHDVKVEASLNSKCIAEINSLAEYEPPKKELLSSFEPEYVALPVINSQLDAESLAQLDADQINLPPAIILGSKLRNSSLVGGALEIIVNTLRQKIKEAKTQPAKLLWQNTLIIASGAKLSHHLNPMLHLSDFKHYITEELPTPEPGDILVPMAGRHSGTIWMRNLSISGDGEFVISPEHWPITADASVIGNKAYNHREFVSRNKLDSPPYLVLTQKAFSLILEHNGVKSEYDKLLNGNGHAPIEEIFATIRSNLKSIPPKIWDQVVKIIYRQVESCDGCRLVARSNSTKEDVGGFKQYAGAFETYHSLSLSPETNSVNELTNQPTTLAEGILAVIASMFTADLAENLAEMLGPDRKKVLVNWAMPVKIDKQIEAVVSGVATAIDPDGDQDVLTVTAQAGIGGVVDGIKVGQPILTVKADRQTMEITSLVVDYADRDSIELKSAAELSDHFPPELTLSWIIAIMNAVDKVQKVSNKIEIEWAIDHEHDKSTRLWINQAR